MNDLLWFFIGIFCGIIIVSGLFAIDSITEEELQLKSSSNYLIIYQTECTPTRTEDFEIDEKGDEVNLLWL